MLSIGDLVGRRVELRETLAVLRGRTGKVRAGVQLTGIGGIGKSSIAGRVMSRVAEEGWAVASYSGAWTLGELARTLGAGLMTAGEGAIDGAPVVLVEVHAARHDVTVALDAKSHRIVELRYVALTQRGYAPIVRRVTEWKQAGKLALPVRVQTVAAEALASDDVAGETTVELDAALDEQLFASPAR